MTTYYEVKGTIQGTDNTVDVLFGSFARSDCTYELDAERDYWRSEGYKALHIAARMTDEKPDPEVYADDTCEICGDIDELSHNDETGLALCLSCDLDNQPGDQA